MPQFIDRGEVQQLIDERDTIVAEVLPRTASDRTMLGRDTAETALEESHDADR